MTEVVKFSQHLYRMFSQGSHKSRSKHWNMFSYPVARFWLSSFFIVPLERRGLNLPELFFDGFCCCELEHRVVCVASSRLGWL